MKNTIKFVAVCVGAPVVALGVGACLVGGNAPGSPAQGGRYNGVDFAPGLTQSGSGVSAIARIP